MFVRTQIEIAAPASRVWRALCALEAYAKWNPYWDAHGVAALGEVVLLRIGVIPERRRRVRARITAFEHERRLTFRRSMLLAQTTETFTIAPNPKGALLGHEFEMTGAAGALLARAGFDVKIARDYHTVDVALAQHLSGGRLKMSVPERRSKRS